VARSFPTLPIVIGELGYPWIDEALVLMGKHERVWADLSGIVARPWQLYTTLLTAVGLGVMDKLLFASGFPFEQPAKAIENLYSLHALSQGTTMPGIPRALIRGIVERDALECLGIPAPQAADNGAAGAAARPFVESRAVDDAVAEAS
jgi:predicted TIM-barrel fold metal-dependent hydrolase